MGEENRPSNTDPAPEEGGVSSIEHPEQARLESTELPGKKPVAQKREDVRAWLAGGLATLFAAMVIAIFVSAVVGGDQWPRVQEFVQVAFGTVAGIVGTIVGFYFGSQR